MNPFKFAKLENARNEVAARVATAEHKNDTLLAAWRRLGLAFYNAPTCQDEWSGEERIEIDAAIADLKKMGVLS